MAYVEKTLYVAACDVCGEEHEHPEFVAWSDQDGARAAALDDADWAEDDEGRLRCLNCRQKDGGDLLQLALEDEEEDDAD